MVSPFPPEIDFQGVHNRDLAGFLQSAAWGIRYIGARPFRASRVPDFLFRQTKILQKREIVQIFNFVREHEMLLMMTKVSRGRKVLFLNRDMFCAFAAMCWVRREMFRGLPIQPADLHSIVEQTSLVLGSHRLRDLLKIPTFKEKDDIQRPVFPSRPIVQAPVEQKPAAKSGTVLYLTEPKVPQNDIWDRERVERLLKTCPEGDDVIDYDHLQLPLGTANVLMCIDRKVRQDNRPFDFQPSAFTYTDLRRALNHCLRAFDDYPQVKNIVDVFFFVLEGGRLKQEPPASDQEEKLLEEEPKEEEPTEEDLEKIERRLNGRVY